MAKPIPSKLDLLSLARRWEIHPDDAPTQMAEFINNGLHTYTFYSGYYCLTTRYNGAFMSPKKLFGGVYSEKWGWVLPNIEELLELNEKYFNNPELSPNKLQNLDVLNNARLNLLEERSEYLPDQMTGNFWIKRTFNEVLAVNGDLLIPAFTAYKETSNTRLQSCYPLESRRTIGDDGVVSEESRLFQQTKIIRPLRDIFVTREDLLIFESQGGEVVADQQTQRINQQRKAVFESWIQDKDINLVKRHTMESVWENLQEINREIFYPVGKDAMKDFFKYCEFTFYKGKRPRNLPPL